MNKSTKIVAALMAIGLVSPMAYATNGAVMMAVGAQNTALGGSGVANFTGADSVFANPAMLGKSKGSEVTGGLVLFYPDVATKGMNPAGLFATSDANVSYIPDVSYSKRISDSLTFGVAMAGIAGMGVDYKAANPATHVKAITAHSVLHIVPTIAYNQKDFGIGFSPVLQYGTLMIAYNNGAAYNAAEKVDSSTGFGFALGGYYNVSPALTVAASYSSEIAAKYGTQLSGAGKGFGLAGPGSGGAAFGDGLNQPVQIKAGIAYAMSDAVTVTADYKVIQYGSAEGWKDFNWKDQAVTALGVKYAGKGYWLGLGYNHADDPIAQTPASTYREAVINLFNNMMFPGIVKSSMAFGGGYNLSKALDVEAAAVITPEVNKVVKVGSGSMPLPATNETRHSQSSYSVSLRYKF